MQRNNFTKFMVMTLMSASFLATSCGNTQDGDPNTIVFWHTFGDSIEAIVERKIAQFEEVYEKENNVDIKIDFAYQGGYDEILDKTTKSFTSGSVPTIAVAYPDHVANYLAIDETKDYVYNLEPFFNDPEIGFGAQESFNPSLKGVDDFVPSFLEEGQNYIKEGTYSLPLMKSSEILLYNVSKATMLIRAYDSSVTNVQDYINSLDWNEFMDLCEFATNNLTQYGDALKTPLIYDSDANLYISQSYQRDIPYLSLNNGKGGIDFNNDEAKALVTELKSNYDKGLFLTKGTNNDEYGSDSFTREECIFTVGSTGGAGYNDPASFSGFEVGVAKVPSAGMDEAHNKYVSQGVTLTILKNPRYSDEVNDQRAKIAWQLMEYLTNEENNIDICLSSNGYAPVRESSYENEVYLDFMNEEDDFMAKCARTVAYEINGNYFNYPVFQGSARARDEVGGIITQVLLDEKTVEQAFDDAYNQTLINM